MLRSFRSLIVNLGLICLSCLLMAGIAELAVRKWAPRETSVPWQDDMDGVICMRPNVHGIYVIPHTFDVRMNVNSQRFRGSKDYSPEPVPGVLRVVALGDSFTYGVGANDNEAYPFRLEQEMKTQLANRGLGAIEILNAGASSTGTADQSLFYHIWISRFKPRLVLLNVWANDVDEDMGRSLFVVGPDGVAVPRDFAALRAANQRAHDLRKLANSFPGYSFLAQHLQLFGFIRTTATIALNAKRFHAFAAGPSDSAAQDEMVHFRQVGLPLMAAELRWLHRRVEADGAQLVVVNIPPREVIYPERFPNDVSKLRLKSPEIGRTLLETTQKESIPFIDLTNSTREHAATTREPLYYFTGDFHATPLGYETFAHAVSTFLMNRVMTPDLWQQKENSAPRLQSVSSKR